MKKKNICTIIILLFLLNTATSFSQFMQVEISTRLANALRNAKPTENIKVLVLLKDRVDIEALDRNLSAMNADINFRARTVITQLKQKANTTQEPLLANLQELKNSNKVNYFESYWITNLIPIVCVPCTSQSVGIVVLPYLSIHAWYHATKFPLHLELNAG